MHVNRSSTTYVDVNLHSINIKPEHKNNVALMSYMYMLLVTSVYNEKTSKNTCGSEHTTKQIKCSKMQQNSNNKKSKLEL